jgi:hypothetical protein
MNDTISYVLASIKRTSENDYSWLITPHEGAVLVAEVERLRGEAERERAAVVAWLREYCRGSKNDDVVSYPVANTVARLAGDIERGEHRRKET